MIADKMTENKRKQIQEKWVQVRGLVVKLSKLLNKKGKKQKIRYKFSSSLGTWIFLPFSFTSLDFSRSLVKKYPEIKNS